MVGYSEVARNGLLESKPRWHFEEVTFGHVEVTVSSKFVPPNNREHLSAIFLEPREPRTIRDCLLEQAVLR
jgi:hypothetical protein